MAGWSSVRWIGLMAWLDCGVSGIFTLALRAVFGEVKGALPLARRAAALLDDWMQKWLEEALDEQLRGRTVAAGTAAFRLRPEDTSAPLLRADELPQEAAWLAQWLEAEVGRVARLTIARRLPARDGWMELEIYCWAQVFTLARLGQVYSALAQQQGKRAAQQTLRAALARLKGQLLEPA